jgi:hypothetical protein
LIKNKSFIQYIKQNKILNNTVTTKTTSQERIINHTLIEFLPSALYADPSSKLNAGKSYVVFGKQDNTDVINLSAIAAGTGGFVINGESMGDRPL